MNSSTVSTVELLNNMYSIIFFGTSGFAVPALKMLAANRDFKIELVVTQPDAPVGRKKTLISTPIKLEALALGLQTITPDNFKDQAVVDGIIKIKPDFLVVIAYGKILPTGILRSANSCAINIHPSLLPKYRGPSPIQTAILHGETKTGVTIMQMDEQIDHGSIFMQESVSVQPDETALELMNRLAEIGAEFLVKTLPQIAQAKLKPRSQDDTKATFTKIINREDGHVDWKKSAKEIYNMWRAFEPWPGIFTNAKIKDQRSKLLKLNKILAANLDPSIFMKYELGQIFSHDNKLFVKCGEGVIEVISLQIEGKNTIDARAFINGYHESIGNVLT